MNEKLTAEQRVLQELIDYQREYKEQTQDYAPGNRYWADKFMTIIGKAKQALTAHTEPEDECECGTKMQTMAYGIDGMYRKQFCPNCKPNTEPEDECEVCALMPEDERLCHTEPEDDFDPAYYWEHMSEEHKYSICEKIDIQIALRKIEEFEKTIEQWFKDNWKSGVPRTWRNCISTMKNWLQQEDK